MTTVSDIFSRINSLFSFSRKPANDVPSILMAGACPQKPGLSAQKSTSNILKKLVEHGIIIEAMPDGSENKTTVVIKTILDEIYRAIREDANVQTVYSPGEIQLTAAGANSGGPVISKGINVNFSKGHGQIQ